MNVKINRSIAFLSLLFFVTIFFTWGFERLYEQKRYYLDKIERLDRPYKSYLSAAVHSITGKPAGLVKSILYSKDLSSTIISENNSILHEENTIHGATIVKIHKDKVEFAKNGQSWTQKVGEPPGLEWYN
ncbi:MAG: hypothetical protein HQ580_01575 [Planctomycetes bacterium]|nr:hypothetical protein [Planctomycetota bacterium]